MSARIFHAVIYRTVNMMGYCAHEHVTLHSQREFADVIKFDLQLILK